MTTPDEAQAPLPVTVEDEKRADDWATMIGRMGGVFLDQSQRRGLASQFAAHRLEASGAVTASNPATTIAKDVLLVQAFADLEWLVEDNQANPDAIALAARHRISHSLPGDVGMLVEAATAALKCLEISVQSFPDVERKLLAALTPSAPEPVQKLHELPEGHRWCRHCEQKDPHCSVCEGVGYLPNTAARKDTP